MAQIKSKLAQSRANINATRDASTIPAVRIRRRQRLKPPSGKFVVDIGRAAVSSEKHPLKRTRRKCSLVQSRSAHAKGIFEILIRPPPYPSSEMVKLSTRTRLMVAPAFELE